MKKFDQEKLEMAAVYVKRMADGKEPASNCQIENELLDDPNVIRCLHFVGEVLDEVIANRGVVGKGSAEKKRHFPVEVLEQFVYRRDQSITYVLKQFAEPVQDENVRSINPAAVNKWLCENGYIEKRMIEESHRECWFPLQKGLDVGMYAAERGFPGNQYVTIMYSEMAQRFLAENMEEILKSINAENR